jgi:hypothetical protein
LSRGRVRASSPSNVSKYSSRGTAAFGSTRSNCLQTSLIPIMTASQSGSCESTSVSHRAARSRTVLPLTPLLVIRIRRFSGAAARTASTSATYPLPSAARESPPSVRLAPLAVTESPMNRRRDPGWTFTSPSLRGAGRRQFRAGIPCLYFGAVENLADTDYPCQPRANPAAGPKIRSP